jgi:hypothetical protein
MAGAFLVWVPAAIYLALTGSYVEAIVLVAWGILVIGSIDNFLSPRLVGRRARLHELLIFFAVLGGLEVFGVLGVVLGPVTVAITLALIEMVRHAHRPPPADPSGESVIEAQAELRDVDPPARVREGTGLARVGLVGGLRNRRSRPRLVEPQSVTSVVIPRVGHRRLHRYDVQHATARRMPAFRSPCCSRIGQRPSIGTIRREERAPGTTPGEIQRTA